jgi:hypothetical protein
VTTTWTSGDTDLSISHGGTLVFTTANWSAWQQVTITAARDADAINGVAFFTVISPGMASIVVTAHEQDAESLRVSTEDKRQCGGGFGISFFLLSMLLIFARTQISGGRSVL